MEQNRHHRIKRGGKRRCKSDNIVRVPKTEHDAFYTLFGHEWHDVHAIAEKLNQFYINPNWELVPRRKDENDSKCK